MAGIVYYGHANVAASDHLQQGLALVWRLSQAEG